jgi:hypothetical protein
MSAPEDPTESPEVRSSWLYDHIGRLAGIVLLLLAIAFLAFLAVLGFAPALGLLVVFVAGVLMIALGGSLRGSMRSH